MQYYLEDMSPNMGLESDYRVIRRGSPWALVVKDGHILVETFLGQPRADLSVFLQPKWMYRVPSIRMFTDCFDTLAECEYATPKSLWDHLLEEAD